MEAGVEQRVEKGSAARPLALQLLGPPAVRRGGQAQPLPSSRKLQALLAYLALSPRALTRSHLCELLWDGPDDPRAELRWHLSKLRGLVDDPGIPRLRAEGDRLQLDLSDCAVDALALLRAIDSRLDTLDLATLQALAANEGELLEGLALERSPAFSAWLTAQRRRLRGAHLAVLEALASRLPDEAALAVLEQWRMLAPLDRRAHERLLAALARSGRVREGEAHLAQAIAQFEDEGLDGRSLSEAWRQARTPAAVAGQTPEPEPDSAPQREERARRAAVAVMPFADPDGPARGGVAEALAHDLTTRLAKLRSLVVIAQASMQALHARGIGPEEAGRRLDVDYVLSGRLQRRGAALEVCVELAEARSARIAWSERFEHPRAAAHTALEDIGNRIVGALAGEIETRERNRAILRPPASLDAWEALHCGLWHMYRFTPDDNAKAQQFFAQAVQRDPTFSRAWAGLSFTHFQNAFQGWTPRADEAQRAHEAAGQSLMADSRDPAAHCAMGRALWLLERGTEAVSALEQSVDLSPNFALAHYTLSFVHSQTGNPQTAITEADTSQALSPYDPLLFAMHGARALALARLGRLEDAAVWAAKGASRPNAHPHVLAIAAYSLALTGAQAEAQRYAAAVRRQRPDYRVRDFFEAFRFEDEVATLFRQGAARVGMA